MIEVAKLFLIVDIGNYKVVEKVKDIKHLVKIIKILIGNISIGIEV